MEVFETPLFDAHLLDEEILVSVLEGPIGPVDLHRGHLFVTIEGDRGGEDARGRQTDHDEEYHRQCHE